METKKEIKTRADHRLNSFGRIQSHYEKVEHTTYTGTLGEMLELSETQCVYVKRSEATELLFRSWDDESKYAVVEKRTAQQFATVRAEIPGAGYYTPFFDVVEDD